MDRWRIGDGKRTVKQPSQTKGRTLQEILSTGHNHRIMHWIVMGMKCDCKLGEDRQITSVLLSDLHLVHDISLNSEKENLVVASSCVTSKPIGHRLLHVSENLQLNTLKQHGRDRSRPIDACWQKKCRSPWPAASRAQHSPSRQRSWLRARCSQPSQSDRSWPQHMMAFKENRI